MTTARTVHALTKLRASLWLIPTIMALGAAALSLIVAEVEARVRIPPRVEAIIVGGGPEGARAVLGAIAGSMIGVTGVTFSITVVALSLASTQFGPRLLRNFMRDRANQFVFGAFIATFLFALLGLRAVNAEENGGPTAWLTVLVALAFALGSLAVLIFFIHHISTNMQADVVIRNVAAELEESIDRMFPEERPAPGAPDTTKASVPVALDGPSRAVRARRSGYLQAVDLEELLAVTTRRNLVVKLARRPGRFVVENAPLLHAWPADAVDDAAELALERTFLLGSRRTAEQDVEFLIDQLVEIAIRSLSPSVNDPFTAMACIDRLGAALSKLSRRHLPDPRVGDAEGRLRILTERSTFNGIVDEAFHQIRQYGAASVSTTIRLLETLELVARANAGNQSRLLVLRDHAERVLRSSRLVELEPGDRHDVEQRHARVIAAVEEGMP